MAAATYSPMASAAAVAMATGMSAVKSRSSTSRTADHQMYAEPTSAAARYRPLPASEGSPIKPAGLTTVAAARSARLASVKSVPGSSRKSR